MDHNVQFTDMQTTTTAMADAAILAGCRKAATTGIRELMKKIEKALLTEIDIATMEVDMDLDKAVFITRCVLSEAATRFGAALKDVGSDGRDIYEENYCHCHEASSARRVRAVATPAVANPLAPVQLVGNGMPPPFVPPLAAKDPGAPPAFVPPRIGQDNVMSAPLPAPVPTSAMSPGNIISNNMDLGANSPPAFITPAASTPSVVPPPFIPPPLPAPSTSSSWAAPAPVAAGPLDGKSSNAENSSGNAWTPTSTPSTGAPPPFFAPTPLQAAARELEAALSRRATTAR